MGNYADDDGKEEEILKIEMEFRNWKRDFQMFGIESDSSHLMKTFRFTGIREASILEF